MLEDKKERQMIQYVTYLWYKNGDRKRKHRYKKETSVAKPMIRPYSY